MFIYICVFGLGAFLFYIGKKFQMRFLDRRKFTRYWLLVALEALGTVAMCSSIIFALKEVC